MQQVKDVLDELDHQGRGVVTPEPLGPGWDKPPGSSVDDPYGKREAKRRRKAAFLDRLYGPIPARP